MRSEGEVRMLINVRKCMETKNSLNCWRSTQFRACFQSAQIVNVIHLPCQYYAIKCLINSQIIELNKGNTIYIVKKPEITRRSTCAWQFTAWTSPKQTSYNYPKCRSWPRISGAYVPMSPVRTSGYFLFCGPSAWTRTECADRAPDCGHADTSIVHRPSMHGPEV